MTIPYTDTTKNSEDIRHIFEVLNTPVEGCLGPMEMHEQPAICKQPTINAHSIPSSTVLDYLCRDGHVMVPHIPQEISSGEEISFKRIGKKKATTFSGLCAQHDNDIFYPIDNQLPDTTDKEHLFLLAYRAVIREFHALLQTTYRFSFLWHKQIHHGLTSDTDPVNTQLLAKHYFLRSEECYQYKCYFDDAFLSNDWSVTEHQVIVFQNQPPTIAVNSFFSLDDAYAPEIPKIALNVFPTGSDVVAIFSATPSDAPAAFTYLKRLLDAAPDYQKYLLSKLILQSCENFVMDPRYYDRMPADQKKAIAKYFTRTLRETDLAHEDKRLYLF